MTPRCSIFPGDETPYPKGNTQVIKKTLHYHDLDGKPLVDDFWFHITKARLAEWQLTSDEDLETKLTRIVQSRNGQVIINTFKDILRMSYGIRHEDGVRFIQSDELYEAFEQTDAYSELFMELVTNADSAAVFIKGIVPADLAEKMPSEIPNDAKVTHLPTPPDYSAMSREDLLAVFDQLRAESMNEKPLQ